MLFGLTNAPASFQSYINVVLRPYFDITVIVYRDDVPVFLRNSSQHEKNVGEVLKDFLKAGLYAELSKCLFSVTCIPFLVFILIDNGVKIEKDRISTILNWTEPESLCEVQNFLGFANFYRRFVKKFFRIAHPPTNIIKGEAKITKKDLASQRKDFLTP